MIFAEKRCFPFFPWGTLGEVEAVSVQDETSNEINIKYIFHIFGSNETMQKVLASIEHRISLEWLKLFLGLPNRPTKGIQKQIFLTSVFFIWFWLNLIWELSELFWIILVIFECHFGLLRLFSCSCPHLTGSNQHQHPNFMTFFPVGESRLLWYK